MGNCNLWSVASLCSGEPGSWRAWLVGGFIHSRKGRAGPLYFRPSSVYLAVRHARNARQARHRLAMMAIMGGSSRSSAEFCTARLHL
eukprot:16404298-Heterocapsa_arctica.AAC.1